MFYSFIEIMLKCQSISGGLGYNEKRLHKHTFSKFAVYLAEDAELNGSKMLYKTGKK